MMCISLTQHGSALRSNRNLENFLSGCFSPTCTALWLSWQHDNGRNLSSNLSQVPVLRRELMESQHRFSIHLSTRCDECPSFWLHNWIFRNNAFQGESIPLQFHLSPSKNSLNIHLWATYSRRNSTINHEPAIVLLHLLESAGCLCWNRVLRVFTHEVSTKHDI